MSWPGSICNDSRIYESLNVFRTDTPWHSTYSGPEMISPMWWSVRPGSHPCFPRQRVLASCCSARAYNMYPPVSVFCVCDICAGFTYTKNLTQAFTVWVSSMSFDHVTVTDWCQGEMIVIHAFYEILFEVACVACCLCLYHVSVYGGSKDF